ncbi:hypothetical protein NQ317_002031 [Molorchus minor]|uniref:Uncharacterized protein n=1 Tax=Molorchus minor TaxID=1323400 RepID=A0ABQ9JJ11_9CUCU|nr:hypothetical protein NQ317_002031 [Molorchus minor]
MKLALLFHTSYVLKTSFYRYCKFSFFTLQPVNGERFLSTLERRPVSGNGESRLDGSALREYFRPLEYWLRNENLRTGEFVGWLYDGDYCKQSIETAGLQVYGGFYNNGWTRKPVIILYAIVILSLYVNIELFL